ncbi:MAG: hypothetical protein ACKVP3_04470 [Hyphomicrobiaceae bacterium]
MNGTTLEPVFARATIAAAAAGLPGVETGTSCGTPALKVRGELILRVKDADTLVLMCALEDKELVMRVGDR